MHFYKTTVFDFYCSAWMEDCRTNNNFAPLSTFDGAKIGLFKAHKELLPVRFKIPTYN